jgi:hypothetical protein
MAMNLRDKQWWLGILVAFLRGGWGAIGGGSGAAIIDPDHFNLSEGLGRLAAMTGLSFALAGLGHVAQYLTQKPVPPTIEDELAPEDRSGAGPSAPASS